MENVQREASGAAVHSRKKLDMTGQRYGRLTVLAPAENIGNRTAWTCRCDCGNTVTVKSVKLREGMTISCGCGRPTIVGKSGATVTDITKTLTLVDGTCRRVMASSTWARR